MRRVAGPQTRKATVRLVEDGLGFCGSNHGRATTDIDIWYSTSQGFKVDCHIGPVHGRNQGGLHQGIKVDNRMSVIR